MSHNHRAHTHTAPHYTHTPHTHKVECVNDGRGVPLCAETAVDKQISFPLSHVLHANGERNGQPLLHDFAEDIQFMDIEETPGRTP